MRGTLNGKSLFVLAGLVILLALGASTAKAQGTCTSGWDTGVGASCTDPLLFQNGDLPLLAQYGTVVVTQVNAGEVTIDFTAASGLQIHNEGIAFDGSLPVDSWSLACFDVLSGSPGCSSSLGAGSMDGFGSFDQAGSGTDFGNGSSSGWGEVIVTITNINGVNAASFTLPNTDKVMFSLQLAQFGSNGTCTGFAGDTAGNNTSGGPGLSGSTNCGGTSVPEPASIALFGSGLVSLAGLIRRRRKASKA